MDITGKTRIFKKVLENGVALYSTSISSKNKDGQYDKMYINVQLPKNTELENATDIDIKKGFLSNYKKNDGTLQLKIVVMEYSIINSVEQQAEIYFDNSDLPF